MEIIPATEKEIAIFKQAAAARYAARGVSPEQATQLFDAQMAKVAKELGLLEADKEAGCGTKHTAKKKKPMKKKSERIEKIASSLASSLGLKRKSA